MTLREAILLTSAQETDADDETVFYAVSEPELWKPETTCFPTEQGGKIVIERDGRQLYYFLEANLINEVVEAWRDGVSEEATEDEIVRVVIYYALNDAWPWPD